MYLSKHNRRSIRLQGYDYSQGGYFFITICVQNREHVFGKIIAYKMTLNEYGLMVKHVWNNLPNHYPHIQLGEFVIMPNHIHGIITVGAGLKPAPTKNHGLSEIIRALKNILISQH